MASETAMQIERLAAEIDAAADELLATIGRYEATDHTPAGPDGPPCAACNLFARFEALTADVSALRAARVELLNRQAHDLAMPTDLEPTVPPAPASSFDRE